MSYDPDIEIATATQFLLKNKQKAQNFIWGELVGAGELSFIVENLPKDGTGCRGPWMFNEMMHHFGASVTAIQGNWTYGDNLAAVNQATAAGFSLEEAGKRGPAGRYVAAWTYTIVEVLPQTREKPGQCACVYVSFKK